jgi:hypothetical protein
MRKKILPVTAYTIVAEGIGGYTPPGKPTEPPPDGQEKK